MAAFLDRPVRGCDSVLTTVASVLLSAAMLGFLGGEAWHRFCQSLIPLNEPPALDAGPPLWVLGVLGITLLLTLWAQVGLLLERVRAAAMMRKTAGAANAVIVSSAVQTRALKRGDHAIEVRRVADAALVEELADTAGPTLADV